MSLARSEESPQRFYSMSSQICAERGDYYDILEETQTGDLDITGWLDWFLACLDHAFAGAEEILSGVLRKGKFWERYKDAKLNDRHRLMLNRLLDSIEGKMTSSKWAKMAKCAQDSAARDIEALIELGVLKKDDSGGRSTSYSLVEAQRLRRIEHRPA